MIYIDFLEKIYVLKDDFGDGAKNHLLKFLIIYNRKKLLIINKKLFSIFLYNMQVVKYDFLLFCVKKAGAVSYR